MVHYILNPLMKKENVSFIRYDIHHALPSTANALIGRAAHIAVLDSELFIEKFLLVVGSKYFQWYLTCEREREYHQNWKSGQPSNATITTYDDRFTDLFHLIRKKKTKSHFRCFSTLWFHIYLSIYLLTDWLIYLFKFLFLSDLYIVISLIDYHFFLIVTIFVWRV